jgi:hypothetical protein
VIGSTLADSLIVSVSQCKMFFSRMLGVCYFYASSELICLSQRISDLSRFLEECKCRSDDPSAPLTVFQ